jgi:hypothetical protein
MTQTEAQKHFEHEQMNKLFLDTNCLLHALNQIEWQDDYRPDTDEVGKVIRQAEDLFGFDHEILLRRLYEYSLEMWKAHQ